MQQWGSMAIYSIGERVLYMTSTAGFRVCRYINTGNPTLGHAGNMLEDQYCFIRYIPACKHS